MAITFFDISKAMSSAIPVPAYKYQKLEVTQEESGSTHIVDQKESWHVALERAK